LEHFLQTSYPFLCIIILGEAGLDWSPIASIVIGSLGFLAQFPYEAKRVLF